jgi:hypothetical protein
MMIGYVDFAGTIFLPFIFLSPTWLPANKGRRQEKVGQENEKR